MRYVAQRIALGLVSLLLLSMMVYAAAQVLPGNPGRIVLGREAPPSAVKQFNLGMANLFSDQAKVARPLLKAAAALEPFAGCTTGFPAESRNR